MSLVDTIRLAVSTANKVTKPLQAIVQYERYISSTGRGVRNYAAVVPMTALVDWTAVRVRTQGGEEILSRATITFLDITALLSVTAGKGIQEDDRLTLPDGTQGPILDLSGFIDAGTGIPYATKVMLG